MKKVLILICTFLMLGGNAYAYQYDAAFKKSFYDGYIAGMFYSIEQQLNQTGIPQAKVRSYVTALKGKVNRQQLEAQTWGCVSKYSIGQMSTEQEKVFNDCFKTWTENFMVQNQGLSKLLQ